MIHESHESPRMNALSFLFVSIRAIRGLTVLRLSCRILAPLAPHIFYVSAKRGDAYGGISTFFANPPPNPPGITQNNVNWALYIVVKDTD